MDNTARDKAHELINRLSDKTLGSVVDFLEYLETKERRELPPVLANAPEDDEPTTEEDRKAILEGREAVRRGAVVSMEELEQELGI